MGITASYARVRTADLEGIRTDPEHYWSLEEMAWDLSDKVGPAGSERLYADKDWETLSWLCSPLGRAEAHHQAVVINVDLGIKDHKAFKEAVAAEVAAMGLVYVDPDTLLDDPILTAFQGRRGADQTADIAELGLHASVFNPEEARTLLLALNSVEEDDLRQRFNVAEIEALQLPGDWQESELDEFYLPALNRIRTLYARAVAAGQHVVVVIS